MSTVVTLLTSVGAHRKPAKYAKIGISYEMRRDVGMKKTTRDNGLVAIVPHVPLCDSYRIQTYNLLIRSQMLYSVELRSHTLLNLNNFTPERVTPIGFKPITF